MTTLSHRDPHISRGVYKGKFIFVRQIFREIFVICVPDDNESDDTKSIYILTLNESMYITDLTEVKLPMFSSINISKIYQDPKTNPSDFIITGSFVGVDKAGKEASVRTDFRIKNYFQIELTESKKTVAGVVFDFSLPDICVKSISKKAGIIHAVGFRTSVEEEVYIQYNESTKKVSQELSFFSEEGPVILEEVHCNSDNEVIVVGYVVSDSGNIAYLNRFMSTGVGAIPTD